MAEEQAATGTGTGSETQSSPLSSQGQSQSTSASQGAQGGGSTSTQESQGGTTQAQTQASSAATKPDWLPSDEFWDGEKNEVKGADLSKKFNELATWKAAEDVRRGALPPTADAYKAELPADFKPPAGVEFKLDATNPGIAQIKAVAHKHGWTQEALNDAIGVYAGNEVGNQARIDTARTAEVGKLGASGPARVDAVTRFMDASGLGVLKSSLITAAQVEAWESHITKLTSQGGASFSAAHRVPADDKSIPGYEKMSFEQRRFAQDQRATKRA